MGHFIVAIYRSVAKLITGVGILRRQINCRIANDEDYKSLVLEKVYSWL